MRWNPSRALRTQANLSPCPWEGISGEERCLCKTLSTTATVRTARFVRCLQDAQASLVASGSPTFSSPSSEMPGTFLYCRPTDALSTTNWHLPMACAVHLCVSLLSCFGHIWLCAALCPLGSSVHGILQARILEWVAMPSSRGSSRPWDQTRVSYVSCIGRQVLLPLASPGKPAIHLYKY